MEKKKLNIYKIAEEAGVSAATVSRTINQPEIVAPEKREKVLQVIQKYDFKPNLFAKNLKKDRNGVIGLLTASVESPFYARLLAECIQAAEAQGYVLLVTSYRYQREQERCLLERMQEQRVESVILLGGGMDRSAENERTLSEVNNIVKTIPVVVMGKAQGAPCYEVRINEARSMELAMEHLIELGHREIAFWGGRENFYSILEKRSAYLQLLCKYGISFREEWLEYGGFNLKNGYQFWDRVPQNMPSAVICINDLFACGLMKAAYNAGYTVPGDFSVVAFDDTYLAMGARPSLTSVACDYGELAKKLIETAIQAAQGKEVEQLQLVEPRLTVRESSSSYAM